MNLNVIVPVYNRLDLFKEFLSSLYSAGVNTHLNIQLFVINQSPSVEFELNSLLREVRVNSTLIPGKSSWYWAKAISEGLRYAKNTCTFNDYFLICNQDVKFFQDSLNDFERIIPDFSDNTIVFANIIHENDINSIIGVKIEKNGALKRLKKIDYTKSANDVGISMGPMRATFFPAKAFFDYKILVPRLIPHYYADYIACLSIGLKQYNLIWCKNILIYNNDLPSVLKKRGILTRYFSRLGSSYLPALIAYHLYLIFYRVTQNCR